MRTKSRPILGLCAFLAMAISTSTSTSIATTIEPPIQDFFSLDQQHHWALVRNKNKKEFLFRTDDGGAHWTSSRLPFPIWRIFFADTSEGWGIAAEHLGETIRTFCIHTSDSGRTWQRLGAIAQDRETPTGIAFDTGQHGWVVGEGVEGDASGAAFVMETEDGGIHWTKLNWETQPASGLYGVRLAGGRVLAWSAGAGGSGIYELRSGALPKRIFDHETMDLAYLDNGTIVSVGMSGAYLLSAEYAKWEETLQSEAVFRAVSFVDSEHGCIAGNEMYCSQNGGKTWSFRALPKFDKHNTIQIFELWMIDENLGWAVTDDAIYEITKSACKWAKVDFFDRIGQPLASPSRKGI
jgi:photosystem II stability/assembly factor-like uncharacterized protein